MTTRYSFDKGLHTVDASGNPCATNSFGHQIPLQQGTHQHFNNHPNNYCDSGVRMAPGTTPLQAAAAGGWAANFGPGTFTLGPQ